MLYNYDRSNMKLRPWPRNRLRPYRHHNHVIITRLLRIVSSYIHGFLYVVRGTPIISSLHTSIGNLLTQQNSLGLRWRDRDCLPILLPDAVPGAPFWSVHVENASIFLGNIYPWRGSDTLTPNAVGDVILQCVGMDIWKKQNVTREGALSKERNSKSYTIAEWQCT